MKTLMLMLAALILASPSFAETHGGPDPIPTIQAAITASLPGDTIRV